MVKYRMDYSGPHTHMRDSSRCRYPVPQTFLPLWPAFALHLFIPWNFVSSLLAFGGVASACQAALRRRRVGHELPEADILLQHRVQGLPDAP